MQKKMERWRSWLGFSLKSSFLFQAKTMFLKASSCLKHKAKENRQGLVSLYRDLEICGGEYRDIRVMWEMIQASRPPPNSHEAAVTRRRWRFCFRSNETCWGYHCCFRRHGRDRESDLNVLYV